MEQMVEIRVLGGFPALAVFDIDHNGMVEDIGIRTRKNRPAEFIARQMTDNDWLDVADQVHDQLAGF